MIWFLLAALFTVYFMTVAVITGMESKFHLVWLFLAAAATLFGVIDDQNTKGMILVPGPLLVAFAIFWIAVGILVFSVIFRILKAGHTNADPDAEYMIILGAHVNGEMISSALRNRLDAAFSYYGNNPDVKMILSGAKGPGEEVTEAEAMEKYLLRRGVPSENLILEKESFTTEENIANCRALADLDHKKVVVTTNRFHLYRALCLCRKQGMENVQGLAADDHPLMIPTYYLREVMAILDYRRKKKI